jgi:hypothetical protein
LGAARNTFTVAGDEIEASLRVAAARAADVDTIAARSKAGV